jgi:hypothetical protein
MPKVVDSEELKNDRVFYRIDKKTKEYLLKVAKERNKPVNKVALELVVESEFHKPFDEKLRKLERYINELEVTITRQNKEIKDFMIDMKKDVNAVFSQEYVGELVAKLVKENQKRPTDGK